jgi:UPF0042 nucleotide-binding protein
VKPSSFVVITGLSGSGKATFLRALEDRGYFCVDNLPVGLLTKFYELIANSNEEASRVALVIDVREGQSLKEFPALYDQLKKEAGSDLSLWFLEASDAALLRRFSETRRPHPLDPNRPVLESLAHEREVMAPIRALADHVLDTSQFNIHDLRKHALSLLENRSTPHLLISLVSFGYKYGVPIDSDLVFDVRFLPNPNFIPHLKHRTGADPAVIEYMNAQEVTGEFLERLKRFLDFVVPQYAKEGKSYVTLSIGCTGGRHRSVFNTNEIARHFGGDHARVKVTHRDWEKG